MIVSVVCDLCFGAGRLLGIPLSRPCTRCNGRGFTITEMAPATNHSPARTTRRSKEAS